MGRRKLDREGQEEEKHGNLVAMQAKKGVTKRKKKPADDTGDTVAKATSSKGAKKTLRDAVKAEVRKKSADLARKLVDQAADGDLKGAEIVLSLMENAKQENNAKKKKRGGPSWAELLASEPEWDESMEGRQEQKAS